METAEQEVLEQDIEQEVNTEEAEEQKIPEGFVPIEQNQQEVNKQHRKFRDEERARIKLEKELEETRQRLAKIEAESVDLTIPPAPDPYSESYAEDMKARDEKIQQVADHNARTANAEAEQAQRQKEAEQAREAEEQQLAENFFAKSDQLGLKREQTQNAAKTLIDYDIPDYLVNSILKDEEGPLIAAHLANNPIELESMDGMSALEQANYLNTTIRPKASLLKPKTSKAPDPPITLDGGGVQETEDPLIQGATFE
jgi:hypothetical protein